MARSCLTWVAASSVALCLGCPLDIVERAGPSDGGVARDGANDIAVSDAAAGSDADHDGSLARLRCPAAPKQAGGQIAGLVEPALHAGRWLFARALYKAGGAHWLSQRAEPRGDFGDWMPDTENLLPELRGDFDFVTIDGTEHLFSSLLEAPRSLGRCLVVVRDGCDPFCTEKCVSLWMVGASTLSMEAPTVAVFDKEIWIAFNGKSGDDDSEIYLAHSWSAQNLDSWQDARIVPTLSKPSLDEGSPAFAPDGSLVVLAMESGTETGRDLFVAYRLDQDTFTDPEPLDDLNSAGVDDDPLLYSADGGEIELFFASDRIGVDLQIYQTACTRAP